MYINTVYSTIINASIASHSSTLHSLTGHTADTLLNRNSHEHGSDRKTIVSEFEVALCVDSSDCLTLLHVSAAVIETSYRPRHLDALKGAKVRVLHAREVEVEEIRELSDYILGLLSHTQRPHEAHTTIDAGATRRRELEDSFYSMKSAVRVGTLFSHFDRDGCGVADSDMLREGLMRVGKGMKDLMLKRPSGISTSCDIKIFIY